MKKPSLPSQNEGWGLNFLPIHIVWIIQRMAPFSHLFCQCRYAAPIHSLTSIFFVLCSLLDLLWKFTNKFKTEREEGKAEEGRREGGKRMNLITPVSSLTIFVLLFYVIAVFFQAKWCNQKHYIQEMTHLPKIWRDIWLTSQESPLFFLWLFLL